MPNLVEKFRAEVGFLWGGGAKRTKLTRTRTRTQIYPAEDRVKDENISNKFKPVWKSIVKRQIQYYVFNCLLESYQSNRKTALLRCN